MDARKICPFCEQCLASAAYYRHVNESVCPKKPQGLVSSELESESSASLQWSQVLTLVLSVL